MISIAAPMFKVQTQIFILAPQLLLCLYTLLYKLFLNVICTLYKAHECLLYHYICKGRALV